MNNMKVRCNREYNIKQRYYWTGGRIPA